MAAKTDMERIGVFSEMGYLLGDKYKPPPITGGFNVAATKGKQMLAGSTKSKTATRDGYFSDFGRVFEKEAFSDYVKLRRMDRIAGSKKNIGKAWVPSSYPAKPAGAGNHWGTLGGKVPHFEPNARSGKSYTAPPRNFTTRPGKAGTGYGYADVTIGKLPGYQQEGFDRARDIHRREVEAGKKMMKGSSFKLNMHPREYFDENPYKSDKPLGPDRRSAPARDDSKPFRPSHPGKTLGGGKFGTFDPYPEHPKDTYSYNSNVFRVQKPGEKVFIPAPGPKSYPMNSVMDQMVTKSINATNFNYVEKAY